MGHLPWAPVPRAAARGEVRPSEVLVCTGCFYVCRVGDSDLTRHQQVGGPHGGRGRLFIECSKLERTTEFTLPPPRAARHLCNGWTCYAAARESACGQRAGSTQEAKRRQTRNAEEAEKEQAPTAANTSAAAAASTMSSPCSALRRCAGVLPMVLARCRCTPCHQTSLSSILCSGKEALQKHCVVGSAHVDPWSLGA